MNSIIESAQENKKNIDYTKFVNYGIDDNGDAYVMIEQEDKSQVKLDIFKLLYDYRVNIRVIYHLMSHISRVSKKDVNAVTTINNKILSEYYGLVNTYGKLLVEDIIGISKDVYIAQGEGTESTRAQLEEEYELLTDPDYMNLFNSLRLDDYINTDKAKAMKGFQRKDNIPNIKKFLDPRFMTIYSKAVKDMGDITITQIEVNGKTITKPKDTMLFTLYLMKADETVLPIDDKRLIFKNVLFYQANLTKGSATKKNIKEFADYQKFLEERIKLLESFEDQEKVKDSLYNLKIRLEDTKLRKKATEDINQNTYNLALEQDSNKLYEYLYNNPEELEAAFSNKNRYRRNFVCTARIVAPGDNGIFGYKYIPVKHYDTDQYGQPVSNVIEEKC